MKRLAVAAAVCAALCGCDVVRRELRPPGAETEVPPPPPRPKDIPPIRSTFVHELVTRRKVDGVKLRVYRAGALTVKGSAVSAIKSPWAKLRLDVPCFVVRHPARGLLLFDTGLRPDAGARGRFGERPEAAPLEAGQDLVSRLRADGVEPAEIKWVVLSDLHFDHAGMLESFPEAELVVDRRELEHARAAQGQPKAYGYEVGVASAALRAKLTALDLSTAPAYGSFDHALDFFGDGTVFVVDLAGHAAGGLGLWVNLDEGPALLTGDATWVLDNHQDLAPPAPALLHDPDAYWRRVYQLRDLETALPRLIVFPGHDLMPLRLKPRGDITLAGPR